MLKSKRTAELTIYLGQQWVKILHTGVMADPFGSNVAPVRNPLLSIEDQPCSNPIELRN
jgi:hypothetical protein